MPAHLSFSEGMTQFESHKPIMQTYLGQAHIAGTGPQGKTCRECVFWHIEKYKKVADGEYERIAAEPGYFGKGHKKNPSELKKAKCHRPILNKANRLIPHHALACRLFEENETPPPATKNA